MKKLTAYHEGGHAIVALNEKASDPIHKATIIPKEEFLNGNEIFERDQLSVTREKMHADIKLAMEELQKKLFLVMIKLPQAHHQI